MNRCSEDPASIAFSSSNWPGRCKLRSIESQRFTCTSLCGPPRSCSRSRHQSCSLRLQAEPQRRLRLARLTMPRYATLNTRRIPSSLSSCSAVSTLRPSAIALQPSSPIRFSAFAARSSPQLSHCALSHLTCNHYLYTSPRTRIKAHALHDGNMTIMLAPYILVHAQATYNKNAGKDGQGCRIRGLSIEDRMLELDKLFSESFLNPHYDNDRLH